MAKGSEDLKHLYELLEELSENGGNVPSLSVEAVAHVFDLVVENQRSAKGFLQLSEVVHMLATFNKEEGLSILLKKISENACLLLGADNVTILPLGIDGDSFQLENIAVSGYGQDVYRTPVRPRPNGITGSAINRTCLGSCLPIVSDWILSRKRNANLPNSYAIWRV